MNLQRFLVSVLLAILVIVPVSGIVSAGVASPVTLSLPDSSVQESQIGRMGVLEPGAGSADLPLDISPDWWTTVQKDIVRSEYHVTWQDQTYLPGVAAAYQAPNRAHNLRTYFTPGGVRVVPRTFSLPSPHAGGSESGGWEWGLALTGYGYEGAVQPVAAVQPLVSANRVAYRRGELIEWYVNDERGLEQGFTISRQPSAVGGQPSGIVLELALRGNLTPDLIENGTAIEFATPGGVRVLRYSDLHTTDATGRGLSAYFSLSRRQLSIWVDAADAVYPITVDPLATLPGWTAESDQAGAGLGFSVNTAGDVNGDGYSDVVIGVPYYDDGHAGEGAVFVYHGSATGLSTSADWIGQVNQANAQLGSSVGLAGDVNGDGYADIVVGACYYDNGQADEGRAYVYHGSAIGLSATPDWIAESDQAYAYMGRAVSTAGDVNGDGYDDVIVSAYKYGNGQTREGRVYVYYGSAVGLSTTANWTAESNQAEARFGYGLGTAGDVNGDGYADIIVGAYWYNNGQTEEGWAFVYHGSATGLDANGTRPNGLPTNADWTAQGDQVEAHFGYGVDIAGDVNGDGYADVIVGAYNYDNGQTDEGQVFVYHGSAAGLSASPNWTAQGNQESAGFGIEARTAGDVNGDGYADVIIGASNYDNGQTDEGRAYIYYGSATGLSPAPDWQTEGDQESAFFGRSVSTAGDVNGDGYADVIVGAYGYDNGETDEGRVFVFNGSAAGLSSTAGWTVESDQASAQFGVAVETAGDVNGDGYSDVIVGAWYYDSGQTDEGRAFVYYGSATGLSTTPVWTAESNQGGARFGRSVSTAGDVNGDGYADIVVGADRYAGGQIWEGRVHVYYGSATGLPLTADWVAEGNQTYARYGYSVSSAGDVNGDGYADVIIGAPAYNNGQSLQGRTFVYHGSASGLSPTANWTIDGDRGDAEFGVAVSTAGDVNGDGYSDVIIGAYKYDNGHADEGAAFVYHGSASGLSDVAAWTVEGDQTLALLGWSVGTAGDVNGDGYSDVIVGAYLYDNGETDEGAAFVYHGSALGLSATAAWTTEGDQINAEFGYSVSTAGDVNGDGYADVIIGAYFYDNDETDEGRAFLYWGSATGLSTAASWTTESNQADAYFGSSVATAGDVNGDGYADVLVGASGYDNGEADEGAVFLYYGNGGDGPSGWASGQSLDLRPRQMRADGSVHVAPLGMSDSATAIQLRLTGRMPLGREEVKLKWQVAPLGTPFTSTAIISGSSVDWTDTLTTGVVITENVTGLQPGTPYHWRARLLYRPGNRLGQAAGRWVHIPWNGWTEQDFRTPGSSEYVCTPETRDSDVALVVDRSGSMADDNKLTDAQAAVSGFLDTLNAPPEQAALVSFADSATLDAPLTTDVEAVRTAVMSLAADGGTRIDLGLAEARAELAGPRHVVTHTKIIVLLSDGQQSGGDTSPVLSEAAAAKNEGALIFTIGLGPEADADLLQQVASSPDYYYYAPSGEELEDIYLQISTVIACPDVGGTVFVDWDRDGAYTTGVDDALGGVEIQLARGTIPLTDTSDVVSGTYLFPANPSGHYTLTVDLNSVPVGYQATTDTVRYVELTYRDDLNNGFGFLPSSGLALAKQATPPFLPAAGGLVTYTFQVSNTGQTPLSPVTVTDVLLGGPVCANPPEQDPLQPGSGFTCQTATLILTDTVNVALAVGLPVQPGGAPIPGVLVSDTAQVTVTAGPLIGGRVYADWDQDGHYTAGTDTALVGVEVELLGVRGGGSAVSEDPDGHYRLPTDGPGTYTPTVNLASVPPGYQATTPTSQRIELTTQDDLDNDFGFYAPAGLTFVKSADPAQLPLSGGWVTFTFRVSNTGQTPLAPVNVNDPLLGGPVCSNPSGQNPLQPGESFACQVTRLILTDTLNVATVSGIPLQVNGQPIPGGLVSAVDWAQVFLRALPLLTVDKDTHTPSVQQGGEVIYTIVVRNEGDGTAHQVRVEDPLPAGGCTYLGGGVQESNAVRTAVVAPQVGDQFLEWGEWTLSPASAVTLTFQVRMSPAMPEGTYDNTARVVSLETGYVDDQGEVGEDAGTPAGRDPETDEDVTVVSFVQDAPVLYLPLLLRNYTAPVSFPLHVGDAILVHPVAYPGQVYYSRVLQMPGDLPAGGRFYLSSQRDAVAGVLVDDALAILLHGSVVFTYPFSDGTYVPAPAIVELPRTTMETLVGQDVTIEYRDVYGINGEASVMWLIWMP